jgi:hypothetical protein
MKPYGCPLGCHERTHRRMRMIFPLAIPSWFRLRMGGSEAEHRRPSSPPQQRSTAYISPHISRCQAICKITVRVRELQIIPPLNPVRSSTSLWRRPGIHARHVRIGTSYAASALIPPNGHAKDHGIYYHGPVKSWIRIVDVLVHLCIVYFGRIHVPESYHREKEHGIILT